LRVTQRGGILWKDEEIAQLEGTEDPLKPSVALLTDEHLSGPDREKVQGRLEAWVSQVIADKLKPLVEAGKAEDVSGLARGIAFRLKENFGILKRDTVAHEIKSLDQTARAQLRKYGVRFGAFNIYFPILLKPAAAELALTLWSLKQASANGASLDALPEPPRAGLTSFVPDPAAPEDFYRAYGYHVCGPRAVRIDILERLADLIRPLLAWRTGPDSAAVPPKGATGDGAFTVTPEMMSLLGCSPDELSGVLKALGFRLDRRPVKADRTTSAAAEVSEPAPAGTEEPVPAATEAVPEGAAVAGVAAVATVEQAASAEAPAPPKAPEFEEIWRPRRHARGEHRKDATARPRRRPVPDAAPTQAAGPVEAGKEAEAPAQRANGYAAKPARARDTRGKGPAERRKEPAERGRDSHARRGKGSDKRRQDERRKPEIHSAAPPRRVGIETDSPFAALGALRDELVKRGKESSST
jgi:ATP-dependent RNA helicase SUPV3L1/SUV3